MPDNQSPFWPILRLVVMSVKFIVGANWLYKSGWDPKDWLQLLALILGSLGITATQSLVRKE